MLTFPLRGWLWTSGWPETVSRSSTFEGVSAGRWHSCGLRSDGSVVCWGDNSAGQIVAPGGSFTQVSAGEEHSCGLRSDSSIVCWGKTLFGQAETPTGSFVQVSAGWGHSCGVRSDRSVFCLGQQLTWAGGGAGGFVHSRLGR